MDLLIDNKNIYAEYGIIVLDHTPILNFAAEREDDRVWADKSGIDRNLNNLRYDSYDFVLPCYCKASNEVLAYELVNTFITYLFQKGVVVLSLRDSTKNIQKSFLCARSGNIVNTLSIRKQNSLYSFKLGFKNVNPNAVVYNTTVVNNSVSITYTKGQSAMLYWGDGTRQMVSNSGVYTKTNYVNNGPVDVIIDIDKDALVVSPLVAQFTASIQNGPKPLSVQFTDTSSGTVEIWNWNFGDGYTSSERNPIHIYTNTGTYTVSLQVFNSAKGYDTEIKTAYIEVRNAYILINATDKILINSTDKILKN